MFTIDGMRTFHGWTHHSLDLFLDHLATMPTNDYVREVSGFGFPTPRDQAIHIFNCEGFWVHTLQGLRYVNRTVADCPALADVRHVQLAVSQSTHAYLSTLTNEQLNANAELHFSDGGVFVRTPAFILHHVLTHAFHHKGQIVAMCRLFGHPAPFTDLSQVE